jgi:hypothetical protein
LARPFTGRGHFSDLDVSHFSKLENPMPEKRRTWRVIPSPSMEYEVEMMAKRENRSLANMLHVLIESALYQRRSASLSTAKLVAAIRGEASDFGATT